MFADEAELSVRDLATMMLTISDNAAAGVLIDLVGLDRVHATLAGLGLPRTIIPKPLHDELDALGRAAGFGSWSGLEAAEIPAEDEQRVQERMLRSATLNARLGIRTTARETATLLRLIWRDEAGPAAACAPVRPSGPAVHARRSWSARHTSARPADVRSAMGPPAAPGRAASGRAVSPALRPDCLRPATGRTLLACRPGRNMPPGSTCHPRRPTMRSNVFRIAAWPESRPTTWL